MSASMFIVDAEYATIMVIERDLASRLREVPMTGTTARADIERDLKDAGYAVISYTDEGPISHGRAAR